MNLVKQSFKETLWFSQPLQDSPGEIVVFDWGEPRMVGDVGFETQRDSSLSAWPSAGISISLINLCEGGGVGGGGRCPKPQILTLPTRD